MRAAIKKKVEKDVEELEVRMNEEGLSDNEIEEDEKISSIFNY